MQDKEWTYKGHKCSIAFDYEEDNIKAWHEVTKPDGMKVFADISPYEWSRRAVELWIDAGYPKRQGCGPLHIEDLDRIIQQNCVACGGTGEAETERHNGLVNCPVCVREGEPTLLEVLNCRRVIPVVGHDVELQLPDGAVIDRQKFVPEIDEVGTCQIPYVRSGNEIVWWKDGKWNPQS